MRGNDRRRIFEKLRCLEIGVQVNYMPAYRHPVFEGYKINPEEFPKSEDFYNKEISIPMHAGLTDQEIETVVNSLRQCY